MCGEKRFSCSHCNKKFKRPMDLKRHETIHTSVNCIDCGKECSGMEVKNEQHFRCEDCDKKFKRKNPAICQFYRAGHCMFGPRGQNKEGKCYKKHPNPCQKFAADGCDAKDCPYMFLHVFGSVRGRLLPPVLDCRCVRPPCAVLRLWHTVLLINLDYAECYSR